MDLQTILWAYFLVCIGNIVAQIPANISPTNSSPSMTTGLSSPLNTGSHYLLGNDLLYPYGSAIDTINPKSDDGSSSIIRLATAIPLFGSNYSSLYVNNNGLLSFRLPIGQFVPQELPVAFGNPFLALFWADINNQVAGDIYFRQSTDPALLYRATSDIRTYFHHLNFTAQWVFVATWDSVAYFGSATNKVNTFQAVLCTDGNLTFVLLNYEDIQWPSVDGNSSVYLGPYALAGLNSGYNTGYYTIPGSRSPAIGNISHTTNVNVTGRWAFKVDKLHPEDVNGNIDNSTDIPVVSTTTQVPVYTSRFHSTAPHFISSSDLLYPYGSAIDTINPKSDDGSSSIIRLSTAIPLFGSNYSSLYVNNNGLLSFRLPIGQYTPQELPVAFGNPFLALFWADINNQVAGDIYFRQSTDPALLYRATSDIRAYFHHLNFTAQWVFVATWDSVAYYGSTTNKVNTFQAVLCTDGNLTFVLLNYEDIQWPSVDGNSSVYLGPYALVGLNSGYNTGYYTIPGSRSIAIGNISHTTNVNVTGRWAFRVDKLHPEDVNGNIDNSTDIPVVSTTTQVPVYTSRFHSTAPHFISSSDLLYPYGSAIDTINPKSDDGSSSIIRLSTAIPLFGSNYSSLYVNNNGLLSFRLPIGQWTPQELPVAFGNPFLALFWADINNQVAGDIYFRQSTDPALLYRATSDIRAYFHHLNFTAQWVFVATWDSVAYYGSATNKVNTFQAVLCTDGNRTFVLLNYEDIQWPSMDGNSSVYFGPFALVGLNSGYNTGYYTIPGSRSPAIGNISHTTNVNVTGRWAFRVDKLHPEDVYGNIDNSTDIPVVSTTTQVPVYTSRNHSTVPPFISSSGLLYPYGSAIDTINPKSDDGSSSIIRLSTAIPLFGSNYSSLYVNNNGLLSFRLPIGQWTPQELPVAFGNPFLALFWADINNQVAGDIYFRQSTDPALLYRATSDIRAYFHHLNFTAQWVFVATWDSVAYYGSATNKVNTFQAVLCTDGNLTFVLLNYEDIQWPSVDGNSSVYIGPFALAGLNSGYNTGYYTIPGSRSIAIGNISHTTNVNVTGRWAFRVDKLHPEDVNGNIDNSTDIPVVSTTTQVPVYTSRNHSTVPPFISSSDLLYPYGSAIDTINLKSDDGSSSIIRLSTAIPLFGSNYSSLYVNNNGLLSFRLPIGQFVPQELPVAFGNPFLALFWADINNQVAGDIYFRQSTDPVLLYRATSDIRSYFHHLNFTAQWVFVATWDSVAYFGSTTNKVNTFQAVLCTDGNLTFVLLNYEDIQWPSGAGNSSVYFGPFALVGLNSGYNTGYYTIPGSRSPAIGNISHTTNVNVTGRWAFRVDKLHPEDVNGNIDNSTDIPVVSTTTQVPVYTSRNHSTVPPFISSSGLLYPYGSAIDTINPKSDDGSSSIIRLSTAIPLFGSNYSSLYVNNNGLLSFRLPIGQWTPQELPVAFGNPFLALFWADINNQVAGDIYFRQSTDPVLLYRATSDIRAYFHHLNFTAQWVFVATWDSVAYYGSATNKVNTFQAVLCTDGNLTFVLLNYEDIQWPSVDGNSSVYIGPFALAGLNSGYNTGYYTIPGSRSIAIGNISHTTNVNVTGRWAFRVDKLHPEDVNGNIDNSTDIPVVSTTTQVPVYTSRNHSTVPPFISSSDLLYPYGSAIDTINLKSDDGSSSIIRLSTAIPLFGSNYSSLYVNNNGLLSFRLPIGQFVPQELPVAFGNPFLALFWADINNQVAGDIYFRQSTDPVLLYRATSDIRSYFHHLNFTAQWVFVATWDSVAYFGSTTNKVNTFQAVLCTDGNLTFVLLNYEDIQWPSGAGNSSVYFGPFALVGLNSGYNTGYYTIPGSRSPAIGNISHTTNVNVTGRWAFRVDKLHPEDVNGIIDNSTDIPVVSTTTQVPVYTSRNHSTVPPFISSSDLLYLYGSAIDTINPKSDDGSSSIIRLSTAIPLFGSNYSSLYVNNNGLLSFRSPIGQYVPQELPVAFGNPFLALFWADINNQIAGDIYFRQSTDPALLYRATSDIRAYFHHLNFTAQWVFVATWDSVAYYGSATNKVNTFQAVLCTDGNSTFALFNYEDIQWPSVDGNSSVYIGPFALVGLNSGYNTGYYTIPGSRSPAIGNISHTTNVNVTGRWAFRVDKLHPEDVNGNIDNSTDIPVDPTTTQVPVYTSRNHSTVPPFISSSGLSNLTSMSMTTDSQSTLNSSTIKDTIKLYDNVTVNLFRSSASSLQRIGYSVFPLVALSIYLSF